MVCIRLVVGLVLVVGCGSTTVVATDGSTTDAGSGSTGGPPTSTAPAETTTDASEASTSGSDTSGSTTGSSSTGSSSSEGSSSTEASSSSSSGGEDCVAYGEGAFGDCLVEGVEACMGSPDATCIVDSATDPQLGTCFSSCDDVCDCPVPPRGFEAQLACEDLNGAGDNCYISCEGGLDCPDGWTCLGGVLCMVGELVTLEPHGDCENLPGDCPDTAVGSGQCFDVADGGGGTGDGAVCITVGCADVDDCPPAPATGDAMVTCGTITGEIGGDCFLDCAGGVTCPDGMVCHPTGGVCYWAGV